MEKEKNEESEQKNETKPTSPKKQKEKKGEIEHDSPVNLIPIDFTQELKTEDPPNDEIKIQQDLPSTKDKNIYEQCSFVYDKYSKRIIYFDVPKKEILIYNRTKTKLLKKLQVSFNYKVLNACVDKKLT